MNLNQKYFFFIYLFFYKVKFVLGNSSRIEKFAKIQAQRCWVFFPFIQVRGLGYIICGVKGADDYISFIN